jgi:glycosyltransferase involved in cell wall biosynthesis
MPRKSNSSDKTLDVVVRLHDATRVFELSRCLFSMICQTYRPLTINLCTQRFSSLQLQELNAQVANLLALDRSVKFKIHNYATSHPVDARSALLNLGIKRSNGRYLAFLDYDDVIYPNAYELLISELQLSKAAIAFGGINVKKVAIYSDFTITTQKNSPFKGDNLLDLFRGNFCPIHSFVIDRQMVPTESLYVDQFLTRNEDYDLLLRICAESPSNFNKAEVKVGDYYQKNDGSNTTLVPSNHNGENISSWIYAAEFIDSRKRVTPLSAKVRLQLGLSNSNPNLTIGELLDQRILS